MDCFYNHDKSELNTKVGKEPKNSGDVGMLVIHPDECIHCGACEPECPVDAIYEDDDVPEKWKDYIELNSQAVEKLSDKELESARVTMKG